VGDLEGENQTVEGHVVEPNASKQDLESLEDPSTDPQAPCSTRDVHVLRLAGHGGGDGVRLWIYSGRIV